MLLSWTLVMSTLARVGTFWTVWPHPHHTEFGHIPSLPDSALESPRHDIFLGGFQARTLAGYQFEKFHIDSAMSRFIAGIQLIMKPGNKSAIVWSLRVKFAAWAQLHGLGLRSRQSKTTQQLGILISKISLLRAVPHFPQGSPKLDTDYWQCRP